MKTVSITYTSGLSVKIPCNDCKELEENYIITINKNIIKTIKESDDFPAISGVRID